MPGMPMFDLAEAAEEQPEASAAAAALQDSEELEGGEPGQRRGHPICVEIVIEGWPDIGILPSEVR